MCFPPSWNPKFATDLEFRPRFIFIRQSSVLILFSGSRDGQNIPKWVQSQGSLGTSGLDVSANNNAETMPGRLKSPRGSPDLGIIRVVFRWNLQQNLPLKYLPLRFLETVNYL